MCNTLAVCTFHFVSTANTFICERFQWEETECSTNYCAEHRPRVLAIKRLIPNELHTNVNYTQLSSVHCKSIESQKFR